MPEIYFDEFWAEISEDNIALRQDHGGNPTLVGFHPRLWSLLHAAVVEALPDLPLQPAAPDFPLTSAAPRNYDLEVKISEDGIVIFTQQDNGGVNLIRLHPQQLCAVIDYVRRELQSAKS